MNNKNVFEIVENEMNKKEKIILTDMQREANIFVKKMSKAKADIAFVNRDYFEPIFKTLRPDLDYVDGVMLGGVKIKFEDIKKYYFVKK